MAVKIIQFQLSNDTGGILGLGDDGVMYINTGIYWCVYMPLEFEVAAIDESQPLDYLLSKRSARVLASINITTEQQLKSKSMTRAALISLEGCGPKCADEIVLVARKLKGIQQ